MKRNLKRCALILVLLIVLLVVVGCGKKATNESDYGGYFIKIKSYGSNIDSVITRFIYDPVTKIVYVKLDEGISPYYIIKFGKPEIAIYGTNFTELDLVESSN